MKQHYRIRGKEDNMMNKGRKGVLILMLSCTVALGGCGQIAEDEPIVMVDHTPDEITYNLEEITKGDVVRSITVNCTYAQTKQQEVAFTTGGRIVDRVHVKAGDYVKRGDLLVELKAGDMEDQIATLEYQIKRNTMLLGYLDKAEEFDLQTSEMDFIYYTDMNNVDKNKKKERDEAIAQEYTYKREDYQDSIDFDTRKLEQLKADLASCKVYANLSGKVLSVKKDLEGSTAKRGDVLMTIVDDANGLFQVEDAQMASYFAADVPVSMSIVYGNAKGDYELIPYQMNTWKDVLYFTVLTGPENAEIEVGTSGTIKLSAEEKKNVLRIPVSALYEADGSYYTYVLNDENLRETRFIQVGLIGDEYAEVTGGIENGTKVVRK
ncbi:MAG: efflux RND transporter periplasmic adaptor subunit [Lachnospiraceae bacterium]|nr:efflux RND transporter periplasmic adaptor subunit [Lachnospiraceae bacterium]